MKLSDLDLNHLQVTLDVLCLTLPPEVESLSLEEGEQGNRTTSYCSTSSPLPESETLKMAPDDTESLISGNSDMPCDDSTDVLKNLPNFQYQAITSCVDKIKWMLQDEISSAALTSYPLNSITLEMVTLHVKSSMGTPCCVQQEVPLHFVFGAETSLIIFMKEFQHLSLHGFHINSEGDYYYLAVDADASGVVHSSSSVTSCQLLGLTDKSPGISLPGQAIPSHCHHHHQQSQLSQSGKTAGEAFLSRKLLWMLSSNSPADDSSSLMSGVQESRELPQSLLAKSVLLREELKQETGTTNDEAEPEEPGWRRKGRFRIIRRHSIHQTKEKETADSPVCIDGLPLMDSSVVKPIAVSGTVQNLAVLSSLSQREGEEQLPKDQGTLYASTSTINAPTPETLLESSLESNSKEPTRSFQLESGHDTAFNRSTPQKEISQTEGKAENRMGSPTGSLDRAGGLSELTSDMEISDTRDRADSLDLVPGPPGRGNTSPFRRLQSANESSSSTPFMFSGHVSNTEDGYDGDSSESDSEWDHLGSADTRQPRLPPFWLIMSVAEDHVSIYFHLRNRTNPDDPELKQAIDVMRNLIKAIKSICKHVNQMLLLQELHETHMCNQLLVSESSEDIWKPDDTANSTSIFGPGRFLSADEFDDSSEYPASGYLEASLKYKPGAFNCSMVWQTHFYFHPRLCSGPGRAGRSRGIQALRSVLDPISVNNRKNMFVYKEKTGSVFYLRLQETTCTGHTCLQKADEESPLTRSRSSSIHSLQQKKTPVETEEDFPYSEFRPNLSSAMSDKDQSHDSMSITSKTSSSHKTYQCIALHVHGIGEVGEGIKEELVSVLQNRLDDAVLDVLTSMLARNPMSKLTPEDVQFIQKPGRDSNLVLHFTVPVRALPYLRPLRFYLQQNFKGFLHSPNYTDGKPENHFKSYSEEALSDEDVFLYSRHQASGKSGNKGIACVVLSVVDGKGQSQNLGGTCPPVPCPKAYLEMPNAFELDDLTSTSLYNISSTNSSPGPLALIKVQLWCVGKVATEQLQDMIKQAIRQSLWDLLLEFCVLTAPISEINQSEASFSFSAPTTPVKTRRTGRVMAEQSILRTTGSGRVSSSFLPGISSQTPESSTTSDAVSGQKIRSPVASPTENFSFFKFGVTSGSQPYWGSTSRNTSMPSDLPSSPLSLDARLSGTSLYSQADTHSLPCDTGVRGCLLSVFHTDMKAFLQFGISLGVPTVQRKEFTLRNRHQVSVVLSEFQTQLNDMTPDVLPKLFLKVNNEYVPYSPQENISRDRPPGESKQFVAVGRNINLWRAFMGITESACYLESAFIKDQRSYQKYQPLVLSPDRDTLSLGTSVASSHATTPIPVSGLASPLPPNSASSVLSTSMVNCSQHSPVDLSTPHFVPRQRLLLLLISDKYMDAYLYNWTSEMANSIFCLLSNLVTWNNQRSKALDSLVAQKLGLFIHQPLQRDLGIPASVINVDSTKEKKGGSVGKTGSSPTPSSSSPSGGAPLQLEVLLSQASPPPFMTASMGGSTRLGGPGRTVLGAQSMATSSSRRSSNVSSPSSVVTGMPSAQEFILLMDTRPPRPLHLCQYGKMTDVPCRYGRQLKDIHGTAKRSMEELYRIWRSKEPNVPLTDKQMMWLKQVARLSHYCLTPLLFSPTWRWKLAPVRDHTLELTTIHFNPNNAASTSSGDKSSSSSEQRRSRHNSGSSIKNSDQSQSLVSSLQNRIRRVSGSTASASTMVSSITATSSSGSTLYQNHLQQKGFPSYLQQAPLHQQQQQGSSNSPKPRRSYQDEAWHMTICTNYIQEYIQYLQTLGFVAVQTKAKPRSSSKDGGSGRGCVGSSSSSSLGQRSSAKGLPVFFLVKILLAGMLIFEVGFCEPYVYAYLYSLEIKRMQSPSETSRSQFVTAFLDELDRIKVVMHMHSFTYDYHLRTIHSCISGRQLLFRSGYHLSSFLDDFIKYYQKSPNFARNLIGTGTLVIPNTRMLGNKLYDHVITRNQLYGMTVVRMVPIYHGTDQDTEYALVELSTHKVSYKDMNDQHKIDSFDMGLLVTQEHVEAEGHILVLKFYILLTSQRELYPKLFHFGIPRGSFRPVRTSSSSIRSQSSSRKTSTVLGPVQEASKEAEATSESESHATSSQGSSRRTSTNVPPTMCDEEVLYLGYFSNHETFMLKFLEEQMESTRCHLDDVLSRAEVDCCRDLLWNRLMPGDKMQDPLSGRETMLAVMSYVDFTSLLELVTSVPVSEIDPELTPFLTMHLSWYQSLSRVLASRYPDTHRYFESPDCTIKHLVVMDSNCLDSFMRLTLYLSHNRAELCHVFKEDLPDKVHCPEKPNFRVLGRQNLVEDFVTTCSFHLWSGLLG